MKLKIYLMNNYNLIGSFVFVLLFISVMFFADKGICEETVFAITDNTFVMSMNRSEEAPLSKWVDMIYTEVFKRINIKFCLRYQPLRRASVEANDARTDGEPARIYSYGDSYPNLVRVEESIFPMTVIAYTKDTSVLKLNGWESLRGTEYRVDYPRGMKICENNLPKLVKADRLSDVTETLNGLRKLTAGRSDIYIDDKNSVMPFLQKNEYDLQNKVIVAGIMEDVPLYMYVHKKHQSLIPKLTDTIKALKAEGLIQQYYKIAFGSEMNKMQ